MIRDVTPEDLPGVNQWLLRQGHPPLKPEFLPPTGWIVPGAAVLWVNRCEAHMLLVEFLGTNPEAPPEARHDALIELGTRLLEWAERDDGPTRILAHTHDHGVVRRMTEDLGFSLEGAFFYFSKLIGGGQCPPS